MASAPSTSRQAHAADVELVDLKLEVVAIPVADPDRAEEFYSQLGWRLDADFDLPAFRVVQMTPPGSPTSIQFGRNVPAPAGPVKGLFLIVADIAAAHDQLAALGAPVSDVFHGAGAGFLPPGDPGRQSGRDPNGTSYSSFLTFADPDGNTWLLQEITTRLPGRIDAALTSFASVHDLAATLRRAAAAHGEHEKRHGGEYDENWPDWYAAYMVAEQAGAALPE